MDEKLHIKTQQEQITELNTQIFVEGVHPSQATSPWSNFIVWDFVLASIVLKLMLHASNSLGTYSNEFKKFKYIINDYFLNQFGYQLLQKWPPTPGGPRLQKYSSEQKHLQMTYYTFENYFDQFKTFKYIINDYFFTQFGYQLLWD